MSSIKVSELNILFQRVINKLEVELGKDAEVELKTSIYKLVPTEKWNEFQNPENWLEPSKIDLGDLQDDFSELKKLILDKERATTYVDLDRLASVLREISQVENPL